MFKYTKSFSNVIKTVMKCITKKFDKFWCLRLIKFRSDKSQITIQLDSNYNIKLIF